MSFLVLQCDYYLDGEETTGCFTLFDLLMSCDFYVTLPHGAMSWSSVCDCCFSRSYFFHTVPFFKDSAKEWDRGYHAISRT